MLPKVPVPTSWEELLAMLAAIGTAIGMGKILRSSETLTWRRVLTAALENSGLAVAAGVMLFWFPNANPLAVLGLGAGLATLGIAGIVSVIRAWRGRK